MNKISRFALPVLTAAMFAACGTQDVGVGQTSPAASEDELFGGFEAAGKSLDAVGSLGVEAFGNWYGGLCTATLIGPNTVLSAAHCADGIFGTYDMFFVPGSENANTPTVKYALIDGSRPALRTGGGVGMGQDNFVFHTDESVLNVKPIAVGAPLTAAQFGQRFIGIGYGTQNNAQDAGAEPTTGNRKMGALTLNALGGSSFQLLFATYEDFLANLRSLGFDIDGCLADTACAEEVKTMYDEQNLLPTEAYLGNKAGDAQTCHGDSGGPLLKTITKADGSRERQTFGVVSHGWFTPEQACYGSFYATFDAELVAWLAKEQTWVDPCGDLTVQGQCEGTVASRCTGNGEGLRRVTTIDCADLDQACAVLTDGKVGCTDGSDTGTQPAPAPAPARAELATQMQSTLSGSQAAQRLQSFAK